MLRRMLLLLISFLVFSQSVLFGQTKLPLYEDITAYEVYSAILSQEPYPMKNPVIYLETEHRFHPFGKRLDDSGKTEVEPTTCLRPDAELEKIVGPAIADYIKVNKTKWQLQEKFKLETPYYLVSAEDIDSLFKTDGWKGFREKYPSSGRIKLSAVGFNAEKTVAVVYKESFGGRAEGQYFVFQKKEGEWIRLEGNGLGCYWVS